MSHLAKSPLAHRAYFSPSFGFDSSCVLPPLKEVFSSLSPPLFPPSCLGYLPSSIFCFHAQSAAFSPMWASESYPCDGTTPQSSKFFKYFTLVPEFSLPLCDDAFSGGKNLRYFPFPWRTHFPLKEVDQTLRICLRTLGRRC